MTTKYKKAGNVMTFTAAAAVSSNDVLKFQDMIVVALHDAANGAEVECATGGVFSGLAKTTTEAWTKGQKLYWDNTNSKFTTTATANTLAGVAAEDALAADTTGDVYITNPLV